MLKSGKIYVETIILALTTTNTWYLQTRIFSKPLMLMMILMTCVSSIYYSHISMIRQACKKYKSGFNYLLFWASINYDNCNFFFFVRWENFSLDWQNNMFIFKEWFSSYQYYWNYSSFSSELLLLTYCFALDSHTNM